MTDSDAYDATSPALDSAVGNVLDGGTLRPTHSGLISVQELTIADAGTGLTVQTLLSPVRRPTYEERAGEPTGCKAWSYDLAQELPPPVQDQGALTLDGFAEGALHCQFSVGRGYVCGEPAVDPGRFVARTYAPERAIVASLAAGEGQAFDLPATAVLPADPFTLDDATRARVAAIPLDGGALRLRCASCGRAMATIVRIQTTDAPLRGLPASALPAPVRRYVEISCAVPGANEVAIPAAAMELLQRAHAESPITRIRTAFMRDGVALVTAKPPKPPNLLVLGVGRGFVAFTDP